MYNLLVQSDLKMRALIPLLLFVSLKSGKYLIIDTESDKEVNYCHMELHVKTF